MSASIGGLLPKLSTSLNGRTGGTMANPRNCGTKGIRTIWQTSLNSWIYTPCPYQKWKWEGKGTGRIEKKGVENFYSSINHAARWAFLSCAVFFFPWTLLNSKKKRKVKTRTNKPKSLSILGAKTVNFH